VTLPEISDPRSDKPEIGDPRSAIQLRDATTGMRSGMRRQGCDDGSPARMIHSARKGISPAPDSGGGAGAGLSPDRIGDPPTSRRSPEVQQIIRKLHGGVYKPRRVIHRLWTRCGYYATDILRIYLLLVPINVTHYITPCVYTLGSELGKPRNKEIRNG
jgi:hypothetical protein